MTDVLFERAMSHATYTPTELRAELTLYRQLADQHGSTSRKALVVRNRIVSRHLRAASRMARRYFAPGMELSDWLGHASMGLITAVERYDPTAKGCFWTYAHWWVKAELGRALEMSGLIRVPRSSTGVGCGVNSEDGQAARRLVSTEAPLPGSDVSLNELLASDHSDACEALSACREANDAHAELVKLSDRERRIVKRRMEDATLQDLGDEFGVSRERIRQLEKSAIEAVRHGLSRKWRVA